MKSGQDWIRSRTRLAISLCALATVLVLVGCSTSTLAPPTPSSSPPGTEISGLFSVGARQMYLECRGTGSPTVLLESGFADSATAWDYSATDPTTVWAGAAAFTRVCSYDRPGTLRFLTDEGVESATPLPSRSDPAPMPRTGATVVTDLHELLAVAKVSGPYILVGHSLGGLLSILHARTHPDEVAGLVLVDSTMPTLRQVLSAGEWKRWSGDFETPRSESDTLIPGFVTETYDVDESFDEVNAAAPLTRRPVVMLTAATYDPSWKEFGSRARKANAMFAESVPGARLSTVPNTTHYIQVERPDAVIDAIRSMV